VKQLTLDGKLSERLCLRQLCPRAAIFAKAALSAGTPAGGSSCRWDNSGCDAMADQLSQDGLVAVVKRDCPTCVLAAPVLGIMGRDAGLTIYTQDARSTPRTPEQVSG